MRHSNVEPDSDEAKEKLPESLAAVPLGPDMMVVSGGVVSDAGGLLGSSGLKPSTTSCPSVSPSPSVSDMRGSVWLVRSS